MITFALNLLAVAFFLTGSRKSQQAVSDHVEYLRIFLRCWLFELPETFQVTVLQKLLPVLRIREQKANIDRFRHTGSVKMLAFCPVIFKKANIAHI